MHFPVTFRPFALMGLIIIGPLLATSFNANAQQANISNAPQKRTMTLSATGTIDSRPDMASISTGIETVAVRARDALDDNNEVMSRMMKSLKSAGLRERDISTTQFSVQPRYQRQPRRRDQPRIQTPKIIGYTIKNSLRITVHELDELGSILDRLVSHGSNRFSGIQFGLSDPDKALDEARKEAMRNAIDKAELYAKAANVTLGAITSISEQGSRYAPRPVAYRAARAMEAVPIAPGQHKTSVTVHVTWALEN